MAALDVPTAPHVDAGMETEDTPEGWVDVTIGDVAALIQYGTSVKPSANPSGIPVLRMGNLQDGRIDLEQLKFINADAADVATFGLARGDILFNRTNSPELVGKAATFGEDLQAVFASYLIRLRCDKRCAHSPFVCWWINSPIGREWARRVRTDGVSQSNINSSKLRAMQIPLPPLAEQQRIAVAVEQLLTRVDAARGRLAKVAALLKRFRQSVLAAACSGRLTADWRGAHQISDEWKTAPLAAIGMVTGGITKNAKRPKLAKQVPYLRVANVYENRLDLREVLRIGVTQAEFERTALRRGDLLFVEGNGSVDQIGRVAMWDASVSGCVHQNHLIRFRPSDGVLPAYVLYAMMAPQGRQQLVEQAISSAGLHSLSISKVAAVELPVPEAAEQHEIVRRVEALFKLADAAERRVAAAAARAERITAAVLAKAFRGELVPTEAELARREGRDYEPASVLLDRVRASCAERTAGAGRRGRAPSRAPASAARRGRT